MAGDDPLSPDPLEQLREAADAILDLREAFLDLLMANDEDFERAVAAETARCIEAAMR